MAVSRSAIIWTIISVLLILIIIAGALGIYLRFPRSRPIEIVLASPSPKSTGVYIDGAVNSPGFYPSKDSDSIMDLLTAAGGTMTNADLNKIQIYVPSSGETTPDQKVDINRAESWLLEALPGIGGVLAQRIIDYRQKNGMFRNISELTKVDGITLSLYEKIKPLITVSD